MIAHWRSVKGFRRDMHATSAGGIRWSHFLGSSGWDYGEGWSGSENGGEAKAAFSLAESTGRRWGRLGRLFPLGCLIAAVRRDWQRVLCAVSCRLHCLVRRSVR